MCCCVCSCRRVYTAPWHCTPSRRAAIDRLLDGGLPSPADWTQPYPVFGRKGRAKIAESLWHLSDAGVYILSLCDMAPEYKVLFIKAVRALEPAMAKTHTTAEWTRIRTRINEALTEMEVLLPLMWTQSARHFIPCQLVRKILTHGSFCVSNILAEEREHQTIRGYARNKKYILGSIATNYERNLQCQLLWRMDALHQWTIDPTGR